jgi:hypothetical protein
LFGAKRKQFHGGNVAIPHNVPNNARTSSFTYKSKPSGIYGPERIIIINIIIIGATSFYVSLHEYCGILTLAASNEHNLDAYHCHQHQQQQHGRNHRSTSVSGSH